MCGAWGRGRSRVESKAFRPEGEEQQGGQLEGTARAKGVPLGPEGGSSNQGPYTEV